MSEQSFAVGHRPTRRRVVVRVGASVLAVCAALAGAAAPSTSAETAHAARTLSLNESGRLHLTSHHGFTLNEQGSATGTIAGTIYLHLTISSTNHVSAEVNIYPSGGSLTGSASAAYHVQGSLASFNGTMNITRGSGRYSRARGSGLSFTGTIQRSTDAVNVRVSGRFSY